MVLFPPTIILRHKRENLKKCSLRGLEGREDLRFFTYPLSGSLPNLTDYVMLDFDGPLLSQEDAHSGLLLLDGTWRYAEKMAKCLPKIEKRSLTRGIVTAYRRRQEDCLDPTRGLAWVEALFVAYKMVGRETSELLDHYYWKEDFLEKNSTNLSP